MSVTDPIADILTRIRNAHLALHESLNVSHSRSKEEVVRILKEEGYITGFKIEEGKPFKSISVVLKYVGDREPAIRVLKRISKPGRRVYVKNDEIPTVLGGLGINILSTSHGILTGKNARIKGVGGELLCEIY